MILCKKCYKSELIKFKITGLFYKLKFISIHKLRFPPNTHCYEFNCQACNNYYAYWFMSKTFKDYNKRINK